MRRNRIVSLALAGALALALSIVVSAPASATSDHTYQIRNSGDFCLQSVNRTQDLGAEIVQTSCENTSPDQRWVFDSLGGTRYHIQNENSGRCMDVFGGAVNLTSVVQWSCSSISNETWDPGVVLNGGYTEITALRTRVAGTSSHCLTVPQGRVRRAGLAMQIFRCLSDPTSQKWHLTPPSSNTP
jgi:alpha-galactosidase